LFREQQDRHRFDERISAAQYNSERLVNELGVAQQEATRAGVEAAQGVRETERMAQELAMAQQEATRMGVEATAAVQEIERLTHEAAVAREEAGRGKLAISEGRQQAVRLNAELLAAREELVRLSGELLSNSQRDAAQLGAAREDVRRLRAELAAAHTKTELLSAELSSVMSSTSWRLGAPLRFLGLRYPAVWRRSRRLLKGIWRTLTGRIFWRRWVNQEEPSNASETFRNQHHEPHEIDPNRTVQIGTDTADAMFVTPGGQVIDDQVGMHQQMAQLHAAMEGLRVEFEAERARTASLTASVIVEQVHRIGRAEAQLTRLDAAAEHTTALLQAAQTQINDERERLDGALGALEGITNEVVDKFHAARHMPEYKTAYEVSEPLISVCVPTMDRAEILIERAIKSLLEQTYPKLQILVVGDNCLDDTAQRLAAIRDSRIEFVNLRERGPYPQPGHDRWCVAGANAMNHALSLCEGYFVTHLDDDDRATPDRIQIMLRAARETRADFLWHPFWTEAPDGTWSRHGNGRLELGQVTTGSIFYHGYLKRFLCDVRAYRLGEPGDWNRIRRIKRLRPRLRFVDEPLLYHHREGNQGIFKPRPGENFLE
jgi:hypothetical protein